MQILNAGIYFSYVLVVILIEVCNICIFIYYMRA
jgi:hypothetical protein